MAFQIDPNIPLQAGKVQFDPASILMQAQQNGAALEKHRFEMQKLREDYDLQKKHENSKKPCKWVSRQTWQAFKAVLLHNMRP